MPSSQNIEEKSIDNQYNLLIRQISYLVQDSKKQVATTIDSVLVETYWNIGKYIVEFEQDGRSKAKYGDKLLVNLSNDLTTQLGKGYSKSNLFNMRLFYSRYPIFQTVSGKLGWSHIIELINIDNELERNFYLSESINESWSVRTLKQQKKGDNPPIGIILAKEKDEVMVQYAMYGNNNNLFVSKYQFYLPDLEDLRKIVFKYFK